MQTCPLCGLDLEDSYFFCPEDGTTLTRPESIAPKNESHEESASANGHAPAVKQAEENPARPVVLYCPACAAEYPLTFSECPVHGVPLTKHRLPTFIEPPAQAIPKAEETFAAAGTKRVHREANSATSAAALVAMNPGESQSYSSTVDSTQFNNRVFPASRPEIEDYVSDYESTSAPDEKASLYHKSFRVAAIILVAGLAVLSLAGLYTFYVNATRKPASAAGKSANRSLVATQESAFIPTPEEALDYKEEAPTPADIAAPAKDDKDRDDRDAPMTAEPSKHTAPRIEERNPVAIAKQQAAIETQVPAPVRRQTSATDLVLPRGTYGLVDARLIRMRARQTSSGVRYDLTFNLAEQAGRIAQFERLAVVTRSASGINRSEAMPFYHRLGAAGTLTFTVSVEMKGRAEADWQGRIICTGIGTDNQGRPVRTSFGANVAP